MKLFYLSQEAARLFALLGRCGGGGTLGVKYTESWTSYCDRLIGSLHSTLDKLFQDFETGKQDCLDQRI